MNIYLVYRGNFPLSVSSLVILLFINYIANIQRIQKFNLM